jgi:hypothetical protein
MTRDPRLNRCCAILVGILLSLTGELGAQESTSCSPGTTSRADLGFRGLHCIDCGLRRAPDGTASWRFSTEPEIRSIAPTGRAAGLHDGDRIVTLDGHLITSEPARRRWTAIQPGDSVRLQVRRDDAVLRIAYRAGLRCDAPAGGGPATPVTALGRGTSRSLLPAGFLGMAFSCQCSVDAGSTPARWSFAEAPRVTGVAAEGPAKRAGLVVGDVIRRINGERIDSDAGGALFSGLVPNDTIVLEVARGASVHTVRLVAGPSPSEAR